MKINQRSRILFFISITIISLGLIVMSIVKDRNSPEGIPVEYEIQVTDEKVERIKKEVMDEMLSGDYENARSLNLSIETIENKEMFPNSSRDIPLELSNIIYDYSNKYKIQRYGNGDADKEIIAPNCTELDSLFQNISFTNNDKYCEVRIDGLNDIEYMYYAYNIQEQCYEIAFKEISTMDIFTLKGDLKGGHASVIATETPFTNKCISSSILDNDN